MNRQELLGAAGVSVQAASRTLAEFDVSKIRGNKTWPVITMITTVLGHLTQTLAALVAWAVSIEGEFHSDQ